MSKSLRGAVILLLATVLWGSTFVAQSTAMAHIGPFSFQAVRFLPASAFLFLLATAGDLWKKRKGTYHPMTGTEKRHLLMGGLCCGLALGVASNLQQLGIALAPDQTGKAGFLTAMYILFVPLLGLFAGRKPSLCVLLALPVAVAGLYLLCMNGSLSLRWGDGFLLLCSLMYAVHILFCDRFAPGCDCLRLTAMQFLVTGLISTVLALLFEREGLPSLFSDLSGAWFEWLYAAFIASGIAYTFQMLGQRDVKPAVASLIMSLEAVFALLSGLVLQGQIPSGREWLGCGLMFTAMLVSQIPTGKQDKMTKKTQERKRNFPEKKGC